MKPALLIALSCMLTFFSCSPGLRGRVAADSGESWAGFSSMIEQYREAYNNNNAGVLTSMYAEEAEYISSHVPGLVARGRNAVIVNHQRGMNLGGHLDSIELLTVNMSDDLAVLVCRYLANNAGQKADGRTLLVLKKKSGTWLIVTHMTVV